MDNHAGNNDLFNINYIAGIVDSVCDVRLNKYHLGGKFMIKPQIKFTSDKDYIIEILHVWLNDNNINHFIQNNKTTVVDNRKMLSINRYSKCIDFVNLVCGMCILKRDQLELLKDFCVYRINHVDNTGWTFMSTSFDKYEIDAYNTFIRFNIYSKHDSNYRNLTLSWLKGFIAGKHVTTNNMLVTDSISVKENILDLCNRYKYKCVVQEYSAKEANKFGKNIKRNRFNIYIDDILLNRLCDTPETNTQDT